MVKALFERRGRGVSPDRIGSGGKGRFCIMAIARTCGTCAYHTPGPDNLSGSCTHPRRQSQPFLDPFVRSAELACRSDWDDDFWTARIDLCQIDLKIWGPFLPDELQSDAMPVDLIDWLMRHPKS